MMMMIFIKSAYYIGACYKWAIELHPVFSVFLNNKCDILTYLKLTLRTLVPFNCLRDLYIRLYAELLMVIY